MIARLQALAPEQRIYVSYAHSLLQHTELLLGDPALGLKASRAMSAGDAGLFDFLMTSAETPRMAISAGGRFVRLISDVHDLSLRVQGERAMACFESRVDTPRAAEDFAIVSLIRNHFFDWPAGMLEMTDAWFRHPAPPQLAPYREALGPVHLRFAAPLAGFAFPAHFLDVPLRRRDARLHSVLRAAAEGTLASLPRGTSLSERAREAIASKLGVGPVSLTEVAATLALPPRKLGRGLQREGTTFEALSEHVRRAKALHHVAHSDQVLKEVAVSCGFAGKAPFIRAFRRWTGETPSGYRRRHRGSLRRNAQ